MQLFYAPHITLPVHTMSEEESRHCVRVLRLSAGDTVTITDGRGTLYTAVMEKADIKRCSVRITNRTDIFGQRPYSITVGCAPTKNSDRFEWFAEKSTEIGIDRIVPLLCTHSERRTLNIERVDRVVVSAMKQSLKAYKPEVSDVTPFADVISGADADSRFIAHCREDCGERIYLGDCIEPAANTVILIGPEGDFSKEEVENAVKAGYKGVHLGHMRLRTETAALTAVMIASFANNVKR